MPRLLRAFLISLLLSAATTAYAGNYVLAGGPLPADNLGNDDVITVYVNNVQVASGGCCDSSPLTFTANPGDALHITVVDTQPECYGINPLYLFYNGGSTVLDSVGVPSACGEQSAAGEFYNQTFTVPAPVSTAIPTLNRWGMIILTSLLAMGAFFFLRRQRQ